MIKIKCINNTDATDLCIGNIYIAYSEDANYYYLERGTKNGWKKHRFEIINDGGIMKEVMSDVSVFMKAHRGVIYTVVLVLVLDQLVFKGAFRERVKSLVSGLLDKAEASVKKV